MKHSYTTGQNLLTDHLFFGPCLNSLHFNYIRDKNLTSERLKVLKILYKMSPG